MFGGRVSSATAGDTPSGQIKQPTIPAIKRTFRMRSCYLVQRRGGSVGDGGWKASVGNVFCGDELRCPSIREPLDVRRAWWFIHWSSFRPNAPLSESPARLVIRVWIVAAVLAAIGLFGPMPYYGRVSSAVGDLCHTPLFATLTWMLLWSWTRIHPYRRDAGRQRGVTIGGVAMRVGAMRVVAMRVAVAVAVIFGISIAAEVIQEFVGRTASWKDVRANGWGVLAGCLLHVASVCRRPRWGFAAALICVAVSSIRPIQVLRDVAAVSGKFPQLASFESTIEFGRWYVRGGGRGRSHDHVTHGASSGRFHLWPGDIVGPTLVELHRDWTGYEAFVFDVAIDDVDADPTVLLIVQISDLNSREDAADVFRWSRSLRRGESARIELPLVDIAAGPKNRSLDLSRIRYVDIQLYDPGQRTVMYLDHLHLR